MYETTPTPKTTAAETSVVGILAEFDSPESVKAAASAVRDAGYRRWDVHSPFPVHGIERAMGVRRTLLPWLVLAGGITGGVAALGLQWWTNAVNYPYLISGKPLFSLPADVPIIFELIVLFSALAAFLSNLVLNKLPEFSHATFAVERFKRVTCDSFFISIDASDPMIAGTSGKSGDAEEAGQGLADARALLESAGATSVEVCRKPTAAKLPSAVTWGLVVVGVLAVLPPLLTAWYRAVPKRSPRIHLVPDMDFQPKFKTQTANPLFADRRAMRPQVEGTVAVGELDEDQHFYFGRTDDGAWATSLPMPATEELIERGRQRFGIYCSVCHGYDGASGGMISKRALERQEPDWATPVSLHSNAVRQQADGQIFNTVTNGTQKMPGYGRQIPPADRWAIVLYIRALQLSQDAPAGDVPEEIRKGLQ